MNKITLIIATLALVVALGVAINLSKLSSSVESLGASGTRFPNGISADSTSPAVGQIRGTDLKITDDVILTGAPWCVEFNATSTATTNNLTASSTATVEGYDGIILLGYGSCQ